MSKKKNLIIIALIFILAFLCGNFDYPNLLKLPYFSGRSFKLGLDLQGGSHLVYEADLSNIDKKDYGSVMQGLRDVIERRVNLFGVQEPLVQIEENAPHYRLIVELAGIKDVNEAINMIGKTPYLEFREQKDNYEQIIENNRKVIETKQGELEDPFKPTSLTGKYLVKAELNFEQTTYKPSVSLQFNDEGAKIFEDLTSRNVGKILAIYIDNQLISAPMVREKISGGKAQITGDFTIEEAKDLVSNLNAGALPVPIKLISQQSVGPTLGTVSLEKSLKAGIYGFLAVVLFMIIFYRLPGILASLALIIYTVLVLAIFKLIPVTLTLAGIGGFILSIGMAVDANVLIFSRMKEELKEGKLFSQALNEGFNRAWPSIRDGNLTTLIVAVIFFGLGTSFVKGFALTLSIGILISMFSAIIITKSFLRFFVGMRFEKIKKLW